jgi:hypothetical protein
MKLTKRDKEILRTEYYEDDESIEQIERATSKTVFTLYDHINEPIRIGIRKVIELLGREEFLSGMDRSAFHWDSYRVTADGKYGIGFDSSALFR